MKGPLVFAGGLGLAYVGYRVLQARSFAEAQAADGQPAPQRAAAMVGGGGGSTEISPNVAMSPTLWDLLTSSFGPMPDGQASEQEAKVTDDPWPTPSVYGDPYTGETYDPPSYDAGDKSADSQKVVVDPPQASSTSSWWSTPGAWRAKASETATTAPKDSWPTAHQQASTRVAQMSSATPPPLAKTDPVSSPSAAAWSQHFRNWGR